MSSTVIVNEEGAQKLQPEISHHLQQKIDTASDKAQARCLDLSALMYRKLPKELRDLVYRYLCLEDRQIPIGPYYHFRRYEPHPKKTATYSDTQYFPRIGDLNTELSDGKIRTDHDIHPQSDLLLPQNHIFDPSYMGEEVALEALKTYYQSNSFSVCNVEGGLKDLCTTITLSAGGSATDFVPIDEIRDLQIRIKLEHFSEGFETATSQLGFQLKEIAEQELLLRHTVESLQEFRFWAQTSPLHELNIEVVLMSDLNRTRTRPRSFLRMHVINFLQTVRNMVYELLHDRVHTTVRVTHQDDSLMAFPKNYTGLFKLTKEQWEFEKSKQEPNDDWSQHFWVLPIASAELNKTDTLELGGYCCDILDDLLPVRWGVIDILRETNSSMPIVECSYWPIGRPYNPQVLQLLAGRAAHMYPQDVYNAEPPVKS